MIKTCIQCGKEFKIANNKSIVGKFCSQKCKSEFQKGKKNISNTKFEKGKAPWNKGKKGLQKAWNKGKKGVMPIPWNKGTKGIVKGFWKGKKFSDDYKKKLSDSHIGNAGFWTGKHRLNMMGEKHFAWKGGVASENMKIRNSLEIKLWRKAIFERDNFTCQKTGIKGGELIVHHINNFAEFPELRTAINNGITLSKESHKEFHDKYGRRNNTREQLEEFLTIT